MGSNHFGDRIHCARTAKGLSIRELAHLADIDYTYVSKIENTRLHHIPSEGVIERLAQALDLDKVELLALTGQLGAGDRQLIQTLSFQYPGIIPALFCKLQNEPHWIEQVLK